MPWAFVYLQYVGLTKITFLKSLTVQLPEKVLADAFLSNKKMAKILDKDYDKGYIRYMSNYRDRNIEKFAEIFKALSNPNRLKIFLRLTSCCVPGTSIDIDSNIYSEGCACVGDLGKDLGIVPSTISHHIKELRQAGLIRVERQGQKIECMIDPETFAALQGFFS